MTASMVGALAVWAGRVASDVSVGQIYPEPDRQPADVWLVSAGLPGVWADNGCFAQPDKYSDDGYISWLSSLSPENCLFATAPDVVGDAEATMKELIQCYAHPRSRVQSCVWVGRETPQTCAGRLDAIFIGGSTEWKLRAA